MTLRAILFVLATTLASAVYATTLTINPSRPHAGDTIVATVQGVWPDSCVPQTLTAIVIAHTIYLEATGASSGGCLPAITGYTLSTSVRLPATAGIYSVEYIIIDGAGRRTLDETGNLAVSNGGTCSFVESLTIDRASVTGGDRPTLSWCDPTTATTTTTGYRIYAATTLNGPFTEVATVPSTATTFIPAALSAGTTYFFVQATQCAGTSSACVDAAQTRLVSNIANVTSAPQGSCL